MSEEIKALVDKLHEDFPFYAENFLKIRNKHSRLVYFTLNDAQRELQKRIDKDTADGKPLRYIILKARQLGFSTFTEAQIYWRSSTREFVNSLIIAHEEKATQNLFQMSKLFYEEFVPSLRPMKKYSNEKALVFENPTNDDAKKMKTPGLRSKITVATAGASDTARSGTYHCVHVSEVAFFPNAKNTMTALMQCVPDTPETLIVLESTANGVGGYFYDMWNDAVLGKNDFVPLFFPWFSDKSYSIPFKTEHDKKAFMKEVNAVHLDKDGKEVRSEEHSVMKRFNLTPEQMHWRRKCIANKCGGDLEQFHQEYPATPEEAFISSGRPKFSMQSLRRYENLCTDPYATGEFLISQGGGGKFIETDTGNVKIYSEPIENKSYYIGADVAEGLESGDYSVAIVVDEQLNVVAKYRGHIEPDLFGDMICAIGKYYGYAYIAVEANNHGLTTLKRIVENEYFNIFFTKGYDRIADVPTQRLGWLTTSKSKVIMIDKLAEYIREEYLTIYDFDIINEMYTYVIDSRGRTNAQPGRHDDCVMALGIALQAFLEGKSDLFVPEVTDKLENRRRSKNFDLPEIIDPLFEGDDVKLEVSE